MTPRRIVEIPVIGTAPIPVRQPVTLPCPPWEQPSVSLAGPRPEVEPRRKGIMQHPAPRRHPLVRAAMEAMQ